jgi:hypothetical protein
MGGLAAHVFAQQCFVLLREGTEDAICDSQTIRGLLRRQGARVSAGCDDVIEIRHLLEVKELTHYLPEKGLVMRKSI